MLDAGLSKHRIFSHEVCRNLTHATYEEGDRFALFAATAGTANTVNVILNVKREGDVDDK